MSPLKIALFAAALAALAACATPNSLAPGTTVDAGACPARQSDWQLFDSRWRQSAAILESAIRSIGVERRFRRARAACARRAGDDRRCVRSCSVRQRHAR